MWKLIYSCHKQLANRWLELYQLSVLKANRNENFGIYNRINDMQMVTL